MQCHRTANVCTSSYVAPELLCAHHHEYDTQLYGPAIDVWSAAVVTFEVARLERYCNHASSPVVQFSEIVGRLGQPPKSFGRIPEAFKKVCRQRLPSSTTVVILKETGWLTVIGMGIQWNPQMRCSAKDIAVYLEGFAHGLSCSARAPPAAEGASQAGEGEGASDPSTCPSIAASIAAELGSPSST
jgi:serine/threonine protein kinase